MVDQFARRYANANTRRQYVSELTDLFVTAHCARPADLTEEDVLAWCAGNGKRIANNTIRNRLSRVCTFLRWCVRNGHTDAGLVETLTDRDNPLRRTPRLYGKVQGTYPARWLTYDEAFGRLLAACHDSTNVGLRDEIVLRLGLGGVRAAEIIGLTIGCVHLSHQPPTIDWIGKGSRSRQIVPGAQLLDLLARYLTQYQTALGRRLDPSDPLICRQRPGTPVDGQRRTAAGILRSSLDASGARLFDLLDIQRVLDHTDPNTTQRSYLDPIERTNVKQRAAGFLD